MCYVTLRDDTVCSSLNLTHRMPSRPTQMIEHSRPHACMSTYQTTMRLPTEAQSVRCSDQLLKDAASQNLTENHEARASEHILVLLQLFEKGPVADVHLVQMGISTYLLNRLPQTQFKMKKTPNTKPLVGTQLTPFWG